MAEAPVELLQRVPLFADFESGELKRLKDAQARIKKALEVARTLLKDQGNGAQPQA